MSHRRDNALSKVPEVTLGFWIIKILATTLGETGGDAVTMSMFYADKNADNGGYLIGTGIFLAIFVAAVVAQISAKKFNAWVYWIAIVASTSVGTTMADFFDRSLGIGYTGGSSILLACVLGSLALWYFTLGSINVQTVATPKVEIFYWLTITFSQTLGTALGDWTADDTGLGFEGAAFRGAHRVEVVQAGQPRIPHNKLKIKRGSFDAAAAGREHRCGSPPLRTDGAARRERAPVRRNATDRR